MACAVLLGVLLVLALPAAPVIAQGPTPLRVVLPTDRTVLPIPEPTYPHSTVFDVRNATPPPRFEVKAPAKAPNMLIVLIDDMGFGQSSAFGGPIQMPPVERLANNGLRYNEFHTTALCSPTRTALLSGRNHHMNNMGSITETATSFPGQTGQRPNSVAPLAEMLRLNGYSTAAFGKSHETAAWEVSPSGPTDRWPTRSGFDKFYGFIGGETNQWAPLLYDGMNQVELSTDPNYHFMTDMTNQAIAWMGYQKALTPDKPFFIYFAPGANGASAEGGMVGLFNEYTYFNGVHETVQDILKHYDELGGPTTYPHYAAGWAVAGDTPFTWTKQVASSYGGTRNGMAVHWPKGITAKNEVRSQWHHVIDIAPTILEAAGLPEPKSVNGTVQTPIEGVSLAYTFADAKAANRHTTQYFEIFGNRAIYHDGWLAGALHRAAWEFKPRATLENDKWELYDTRTDFSLANDLAAKNPEKLKELQDRFLKEAVKYSGLPL